MRIVSIVLTVIVLCVAAAIGGAFLWYKLNFPSYTYRYRMTVEVLVDGQIRSGQSVIQVRVDKQPKFGNAPQVSRIGGEAVFVDLGNGRNVTAILASGDKARDVDYSYNLVPTLFGLTFDDRDLVKLPGLRGSRDVPANLLPTFVTFSDLEDPATARVVKLGEFGEVFGSGAELRSVRIEMTRDPIAEGIETKLPLLKQLAEEAKRMRTMTLDEPYRPALGHFKVRR